MLRSLLLLVSVGTVTGAASTECPAACSCLNDNTYVVCRSTRLREIPREGVWPAATQLDFWNNSITTLADDSFSSFPSAQEVLLNSNEIASISVGAFRKLPLTELHLSNNKITTMHYVDIPFSLRFLDISSNPLSFTNGTPLPPALGDLEILDLNWVGLEMLDLQILSGLSHIHTFHVGGNKIRSIDFGDFAGLRYLSNLDLSSNMIENVLAPPNDVVIYCKILSLGGNRLKYLDPNILKSFPYLEELTLSLNPLVVPSDEIFISHPSLQDLDISNTYAHVITNQTFDLPNLKQLGLQKSGVYSIEGAFLDMPHLSYLYLEHNALTTVTVGTFSESGELKYLLLNGNPLVEVAVSELEKAMTGAYGTLDITDSPLACACALGDISAWAQAKKVDLYKGCQLTTCREPSLA